MKVSPESQKPGVWEQVVVADAELELYIIEKHTARDFLNYGIPVGIHCFMILPMLDAYKISNVHTLEKYIGWIDKRQAC